MNYCRIYSILWSARALIEPEAPPTDNSEMISQETQLIQLPSLDLTTLGIIAAICTAVAGSLLYLRRPKKKEAKPKRTRKKKKPAGKFCIDCGAKIPKDSTFCKKCGKKQ